MEQTAYKYVLYLSSLIWVFPVFRQRKTKFFVFFLMFSLMYPAGYITYFFIVPNMYFPTITFYYVAFLSFFKTDVLKKAGYYFFVLYLAFAYGYFSTNNWEIHAGLLLAIKLIIIIMVTHEFIMKLVEGKFSIFILILVGYILLDIIESIFYILMGYEFPKSLFFFFHFIEIFIALFYIIFRADDDRLSVKL